MNHHRPHVPHLHHNGAAEPTDGADAPPIPGYGDYSEDELVHRELHLRTQAELARIEEYERAHENRLAILNKLHYLRSHQPWEGYDELPSEEVIARLDDADPETLKHVRDYEHKFRNRPLVVDRAMELFHERHLAEKAAEAEARRPTYIPTGEQPES